MSPQDEVPTCQSLSPDLIEALVDPVERKPLHLVGQFLVAENGAAYPVVQGVPVLLRGDVEPTLWVLQKSYSIVREPPHDDPYFIDTLGVNEWEKAAILDSLRSSEEGVDPVVRYLTRATNGQGYRYGSSDWPAPIPVFPVHGTGVLLDIGCNWGRWSISAAKEGYRVIGIDPSLGAVLAAKRLARSLGHRIDFVCGDARYLPFKGETFDRCFSYSVLQHLSREDVQSAVAEIGRVLKPHGRSVVQMARSLGIRSVFQQARRGFSAPKGFGVRYWSSRELKLVFSNHIGPTELEIDCFFGLGLQASDRDYMTKVARHATSASEFVKRVARHLPWLKCLADSVYCISRRRGAAVR